MIIGISGKKQHGKDTVAKIIQWVTEPEEQKLWKYDLKTFLTANYSGRYWKRKQFAEKLKQIVAILIGCTVEQLEDNKFKETPLGEEWRIWYLVHSRSNDIIGKLYNTKEELEATLNSVQRDNLRIDELFIHGEVLTPRKLLQLIGTECGRNIIHPNVWVNALMSDYKRLKSSYPEYAGLGKYPDWIITDVRFPNEVKAIEDRGGIVIRVNRPNPHQTCQCGAWWFLGPKDNGRDPCPKCGTFKYASVLHFEDTHPSEISLDDHKFKYTIINNGSIEELTNNVRTILLNLKLL